MSCSLSSAHSYFSRVFREFYAFCLPHHQIAAVPVDEGSSGCSWIGAQTQLPPFKSSGELRHAMLLYPDHVQVRLILSGSFPIIYKNACSYQRLLFQVACLTHKSCYFSRLSCKSLSISSCSFRDPKDGNYCVGGFLSSSAAMMGLLYLDSLSQSSFVRCLLSFRRRDCEHLIAAASRYTSIFWTLQRHGRMLGRRAKFPHAQNSRICYSLQLDFRRHP